MESETKKESKPILRMVTAWSVMNDECQYEYNHIDISGWVIGDKPIPMFETQNGWTNRKWSKEFYFMDENGVVGDFTDKLSEYEIVHSTTVTEHMITEFITQAALRELCMRRDNMTEEGTIMKKITTLKKSPNYRIYDRQLYAQNEIHVRNAAADWKLPAIHAFEPIKAVEFEPVKGKVVIP